MIIMISVTTCIKVSCAVRGKINSRHEYLFHEHSEKGSKQVIEKKKKGKKEKKKYLKKKRTRENYDDNYHYDDGR